MSCLLNSARITQGQTDRATLDWLEGTVNLAQMLREEIMAYVEGRQALAALRTWLADHVQEIANSDDPDVERLDGQAWILIAELDYGHRDEADVRTRLAAAITPERHAAA